MRQRVDAKRVKQWVCFTKASSEFRPTTGLEAKSIDGTDSLYTRKNANRLAKVADLGYEGPKGKP